MDESVPIDLEFLWRWYVKACNWICSCGCTGPDCCACCQFVGDVADTEDEHRAADVAERYERIQLGEHPGRVDR